MTIKELRDKTKLSQSKFAKKFHISTKTLQGWEQGRNTPEFVLYAIETILNYEDILNGQQSLQDKDISE